MMKQNKKIQLFILSMVAVVTFAILPLSVFAVNGERVGDWCDDTEGASCGTGLYCLNNACASAGTMTGPTQCQGEGLTGAQCCAKYPTDGICTGAVTSGNSAGTGGRASPGGSQTPAGGGRATSGGDQTPTNSLCDSAKFTYENGICLPKPLVKGGLADSSSLSDLIFKVLKLLLGLAGAIAVVLVVIGGFQYLTSAGNEEQAESGKKTLINAAIGLVVIILAYTAVNVLITAITKTV